MTKIDFAIHLLSAVRLTPSGQGQRVPALALLALLQLSREPDRWQRGPDVAKAIGIPPDHLPHAMSGVIDEGLVERTPPRARRSLPIEWRLTVAGQRYVASLMNAKQPSPQSTQSA